MLLCEQATIVFRGRGYGDLVVAANPTRLDAHSENTILVSQLEMTDPDTPLEFIGSSKADVSAFPVEVKRCIGFALRTAQKGGKHLDAKPLSGFGGASTLEIISDFDGDTFRAVYTVKFKGVIYVLHAFQKKSKTGIKTPKAEMDKIRSRLKDAQILYAESDYEKKYQVDKEQRQRLQRPRPAQRR
jgi:phage-related protein